MKQFEIWLARLDPTEGVEMQKTRPCVIISPNELHSLKVRIIAPMTRTQKSWPYRVPVETNHVNGEIALEQLRVLDQRRLIKKLGHIDTAAADDVKRILQQMFK